MYKASQNWSTHEWLHFISEIETLGETTPDNFYVLDELFNFTGTKNAEIAFAWYMQAIRVGYEEAFPELENFLMTVGRGKFIYRLYAALKESGREDWGYWVSDIYEAARPSYHPIAQRRIDAIMQP